ncbi:hypothetical protein AWZ03_003159 [Drosophila navojoa]|uniref:MRN complex-interacting protein N-terminal domain-containing protein n=1 Tax=Drosophila navojoa TaxID=7232 RepID=A0A484BNL0_DRONA|nr:MRN complex-interacting protein [Drosophila navojoa]TDG50254.1 hypothetical protein AWZ03_003159 [Drosophila navojoa]
MSQQIRVVQCVECSLYQVDIVKKTNRWECKVCDAKQVMQKEFFRGSGAECRAKVQQLNLDCGQRKEAQAKRMILEVQAENLGDRALVELADQLKSSHRTGGSSKWAEYTDEPITDTCSGSNRHIQPKELDEPDNSSFYKKKSGSNKRKAQTAFVYDTKTNSKWQNFL